MNWIAIVSTGLCVVGIASFLPFPLNILFIVGVVIWAYKRPEDFEYFI